jgi:cytochrome b6-f complex iron-sulfur subunit
MPEITRRDFLKLSIAGLLGASALAGAAAVLRFLGYSDEAAQKTEFDLGKGSDYPVGSKTVIAVVPAMLIHNENGFTAISLVCTHLGCTVEQSANGFTCPCHGSMYASDGQVVRGPAQKPLKTLRVELNSDGRLILHTD